MGQTLSRTSRTLPIIYGLSVSSVKSSDHVYVTSLYLEDKKKGTTKSVFFELTSVEVRSISAFIDTGNKNKLVVLLYDEKGQLVKLQEPLRWGEYEYRLDSTKSNVVYLGKKIRMYHSPVQVFTFESLIDLLGKMMEEPEGQNSGFHDDFEGQNSGFHHDCAVEVDDDKDSGEKVVQCDVAVRASVGVLSNAESSETDDLLVRKSGAKRMNYVDIPSTVCQRKPDLLGASLVFFPPNVVLCQNVIRNDSSASGTGPVAAEHYVRQHRNIDNLFQNETPNTREEISRAIQELREEWRVEKHGKKSLVKFAIIRVRMAKLVNALRAIMTI
jgi:hypothetical protein